ncbi:MAG TPA: transcription termination factor Rho [Longimicrobiales bacterium]|nr:transcription termination factor Rho [Longimicrobiales bacterium]
MDIAELRNKTLGELQEMADELGVHDAANLNRRKLIHRIQKNLLANDVGLQAHGVLETLPQGYGFLRSQEWSYLPSPDDVYVSKGQVKRLDLRTGDSIVGQVRPPRKGERYMALTRIDRLNDLTPDPEAPRSNFDKLRPRYPEGRLRLEENPPTLSMRVVDLIAPIGKGQRGLIVSPPKAGKTTLLKQVARGIIDNHPEVHLIILLIDERPEEVTEMQQHLSDAGEVVASTFDEPATRHVQVAEMVLEKAKRLVEAGHHVVILLDSITRLARAYNTVAPRSGKILTGGVDAGALQKPKKFFGSARNIDAGGSLTIIATALVDTGSRMDEVIFEEFKGTGNMELVLDRHIAEQRIFPAIDLNKSGTRKEELLLSERERNRVFLLRNYLGDHPPVEAIEFLLGQMRKYETNDEFMDAMAAGG